jgi:hypothetical protein
LLQIQTNCHLEESDGLGVEPPVVPLAHGSLVGEVDEPALLQDLRPDPLRLLDRLNQTLDWNVRLDPATLKISKKMSLCKKGFLSSLINKIVNLNEPKRCEEVFRKIQFANKENCVGF